LEQAADPLVVVGDDGSTTTGGDMVTALARPFRSRGSHQLAAGAAAVKPIEIFAPDRSSTELLLEVADPMYRAEIAPGCVWIVRLQPPPTGGGWALGVLSLVQHWLERTRLPFASVRYDGRSYLIRPSTDVAQFATAETARDLSTQFSS
jgi:hypothetical protein